MPDKNLEILIRTAADLQGAELTKEQLEHVKRAADELNRTYKTHSKGGVEELNRANTRTARGLRQINNAARALAIQFPLLGRVFYLFANPISIAVGGIVGAFALWRKRVNELNTALSNVELPSISPRDISQVSDIAKAYEEFAKSVRDSESAFHSAEAAYNRGVAAIDRQVAAQKRLMDARKQYELAQAKTPEARAAIESRYAAAGLGVTEGAARQRLGRMMEQQAMLQESARAKLTEAERINPGFGGITAQSEQDLKAMADAAAKEITERRKRIAALAAFQGGEAGFGASIAIKAKQFMTGLSPAELISIERSRIGTAQASVNRYQAYLRSEPINARRAELISGAAADAARAREIGLQLPGEISAAGEDILTGRRVAGLDQATRNVQLGQTLATESGQLTGKATALQQQLVRSIQSTGRVMESTLQALRENQARQAAIERELRDLRSRRRGDLLQ